MGVEGRRAQEREMRKGEVLDAAERTLRELGVRETTMQEIADRAELAKGTLYLYFETREALLAAVVARAAERVAHAIAYVPVNHGTGLQELAILLSRVNRDVVDNDALLRAAAHLLAHGHDLTTELLEYRELVVRGIAAAIEKGANDGSIRSPKDSLCCADQVWSCLMGALTLARKENLEERGEEVAAFLLRGLAS